MRSTIILLTLLSACSSSWDPDDFPGAQVRLASSPEHAALWHDAAEQVMTIWAARLGAYGCPAPFRFAERWEEGYEVRLVEPGDWDALGYPKLVGMCWHDRIEVKHNSYFTNTLAHEMGHAMGLGHHHGDEPSLMDADAPANAQLDELSVRAAACLMGCGPCDTISQFD